MFCLQVKEIILWVCSCLFDLLNTILFLDSKNKEPWSSYFKPVQYKWKYLKDIHFSLIRIIFYKRMFLWKKFLNLKVIIWSCCQVHLIIHVLIAVWNRNSSIFLSSFEARIIHPTMGWQREVVNKLLSWNSPSVWHNSSQNNG